MLIFLNYSIFFQFYYIFITLHAILPLYFASISSLINKTIIIFDECDQEQNERVYENDTHID